MALTESTKRISADSNFDVTQIFDLLESNNPDVVQEIKAIINDNFNTVRDNWLVGGLYEYYIHSGGSVRCSEILCGAKEPHDKFLIDKIAEGIRSTSKDTWKQSFIFLGQVVSKQPSWLYKITQNSLFREITRLLKTETDVIVLLTGLLSVIMIIPTIPTYIVAYINEIFDVFGRLATWTHTTLNIPKEHLLHLQVGLYSLFHRLYAIFPCNFLSYLRHTFSSYEKRVVFLHTIMPMLEKVKMHPALVTATKDGELNPQRWRGKEYHEIIADCSKISLDVYESSFPEEVTPTFSRLNSVDDDRKPSTVSFFNDSATDAIMKLPPSSLIMQAMRTSDLTSLISYIDDSSLTAPPTPLSTGPASTAPTPLLVNKAVSPPETAMEATPENTPIKDRDRLHFKLPPTSPAAVQLNFANIDHIREKYARPPTTPVSSIPSSPLPANNNADNNNQSSGGTSTHTLVRRDSIFDSTNATAITLRRDSLMLQRLQKIQLEQQNQSQQPQILAETTCQPTTPTPITSTVVTSKAPSSSDAQPTLLQRKTSIPAPITISNNNLGNEETSDFLNDRDRPTGGPLTPMFPINPQQQQQQGFLDPDLSLITLDEETTVDECHATSACPKGGLHMPDHGQMIAFAKRVSRLRFHSQCGPAPNISELNTSLAPSPGTSPSSTSSTTGVNLFKGRVIKRSFSCPNIKKPTLNEVAEIEGTNEDITVSSTILQEPTLPTVEEVGDKANDEIEHPYEHLFQKILPTVLSPPTESRTLPSPHLLLDLCIMKAAQLHNAKSKGDELFMLRGQVELLHGQLLFERHRREAHALRNRRLANKFRKVQNMEEQNNTMRREIHNLEKEIALLKQEVTIQRSMGLTKEKELQGIITEMEKKMEGYRKQLSDVKDDNSQVDMKFRQLQDEFNTVQKESDQKKADLFTLENEVKHLQKYLEMNHDLRLAYDVSQREIIILGELLRRHQENASGNNSSNETQRYLKEEIEDLRQTCEEEIRGLRNMLESKMSQCEVACGMIQDLEKKLEKRETIIMEQKQNFQDVYQDHLSQLQVMDNKYESVKEANHKLELEILNLQHQLTLKNYSSRTGRSRITSSPSNGEMSPTGNSNHSDVDSAASAAGYQMSSPDRNICIFGSPQFDVPTDEMRDLQSVLDEDPPPSSSSGIRRNSQSHDNSNKDSSKD